MKTIADTLRDVSHPVQDSDLVLNLLRGLNRRFSNIVDIIANSTVLPNFTTTCNMFTLKELCLANKDKVSSGTSIVATGCTTLDGCPSSIATTKSSTPAPDGKPKGNSGRRSNKGKGSNGGGYNGGPVDN